MKERTTTKHRKPKFELREPAKPLSARPLDPNHPAAQIFAEVKRAESASAEANQEASAEANQKSSSSLADSARLAESARLEESASLANQGTHASHFARLAESASLADSSAQIARPQPDLNASLPEVKGYLRLHYQLIDHLLPQLQPAEAVVYLQLYRLSWGFRNSSCLISYAGIAARCGISSRAAQDVTARLVDKGLIERMKIVTGAGKAQGIEWRVAISASLAEFARLANSATNKEKDLKEINKKGSELALDIKSCPDCRGTGFWYPSGIEQGVTKCPHSKLVSSV